MRILLMFRHSPRKNHSLNSSVNLIIVLLFVIFFCKRLLPSMSFSLSVSRFAHFSYRPIYLVLIAHKPFLT